MQNYNFLKKAFNDFDANVAKSFLTGLMNEDVFDDFPKNVPKAIRSKWQEEIGFIDGKINDNHEGKVDRKFRYVLPLIKVFSAGGFKKGFDFDFQKLHLEQEFIMYFTFLEGLFQDYLRVIYKHEPKYISGEKPVDWKTILNLKNFDNIHEHLIEKELEKSGYQKISDLIRKLNNKPFQFRIRLKTHDIDKLHELILIRNFLIHNNSKVSNDYLEHVKTSNYSLGEEFQLDRNFLYKSYDLISHISFETLSAIAIKLFDKKYESLCEELGHVENYESKWD